MESESGFEIVTQLADTGKPPPFICIVYGAMNYTAVSRRYSRPRARRPYRSISCSCASPVCRSSGTFARAHLSSLELQELRDFHVSELYTYGYDKAVRMAPNIPQFPLMGPSKVLHKRNSSGTFWAVESSQEVPCWKTEMSIFYSWKMDLARSLEGLRHDVHGRWGHCGDPSKHGLCREVLAWTSLMSPKRSEVPGIRLPSWDVTRFLPRQWFSFKWSLTWLILIYMCAWVDRFYVRYIWDSASMLWQFLWGSPTV